MRQFRESQLPLVPIWGSHQHTRELQMAARILDAHPQIAKFVQKDLLQGRRSDRGRQGLSGDQVLRIALLKQIHGLSYRELEFHLQDSDAFRAPSLTNYEKIRLAKLGKRLGLKALKDVAAIVKPETILS